MTTRAGGRLVAFAAALLAVAPAVRAEEPAPPRAEPRLAPPPEAPSPEAPSPEAPPPEAPPPEAPPPEAPPPEAPSAQIQADPPAPTVPAIPELPPLPPEASAPMRLDGPPYFAPGSPGYYALWYGPEWALVGILGALELFQPFDLVPPGPALLGPRFDDRDPDAALLTDPRLDDVIGRPFLREKVPPVAIAVLGLSGLAGAGVVDVIRHGELHHTHNLILGGLTAVTVTQLTTNVLKASVGRLRPDFRDRYRHASCQGLAPRSPVVDCAALASAGGFVLPDDEYLEGYRSFPSGHASSSFAFATYLSLWLGSEFVWAGDTGALEASLGSLGIGALYAGALYASASRLADNRHHPEDVAVGAALGTGIAAAAWLLHFDLAGNARWRGIELTPGPGDAGVSVAGRF